MTDKKVIKSAKGNRPWPV